MDNKDRRKYPRYDMVLKLMLYVPVSLGDNQYKIPGWIIDISEEGIAMEVYTSECAEIRHIVEKIQKDQMSGVLISMPKNLSVKAECKIIWERFEEKTSSFQIRLQILNIDQTQKETWDSFLKYLSNLKKENITFFKAKDSLFYK